MIRALFLLGAAAILFEGCGYHTGQGPLRSQYKTVSVPYVSGDNDGDLTAAIVKELTSSGGFGYRCERGQLLVNVKLLDVRDDDIGFRYDRNKKGEFTNYIIPAETRATATVELEVVEACSGIRLLGPVIITASVDFDHDFYASTSVNVFSLGQITDVEAAKAAVRRPLNRRLAAQITDYINASW